jgi:hypothetical protein
MLETISLFPESRFFRARGEVEMHHKCGGLASVFIIVVCLGILAYKLIELFGRGTIYYSSNTNVELFPSFTTISTFANQT